MLKSFHPTPEAVQEADAAGASVEGIVIGSVRAVDGPTAHVVYEVRGRIFDRPAPMLRTVEAGASIALMFQDGVLTAPVCLGALEDQGARLSMSQDGPLEITTDNEKTKISHPLKLQLACGKAVITLTADGRVELNGETLVSIARGTNRIAGGSVKIN